ncbi:MAG: hypothetical protein HC811_03015 [Flammeovirgaceae bacterium]|nr:hypothetical protein [Flammeovirgaceae bacterium]
MKKNHFQFLLLMLSVVLLTSFTIQNFQEDWAVPAKYKNMENPTKASKDNLDIAKGKQQNL